MKASDKAPFIAWMLIDAMQALLDQHLPQVLELNLAVARVKRTQVAIKYVATQCVRLSHHPQSSLHQRRLQLGA